MREIIFRSRKKCEIAFQIAMIDIEQPLTSKPIPVVFFPIKEAVDNFNNVKGSATEKMIYVTNFGWRRVHIGNVFNASTSNFFIKLGNVRTVVLFC